MRRYWREEKTGDIYDRETGRWITPIKESHHPRHHEVVEHYGTEHRIRHDEIEERQ